LFVQQSAKVIRKQFTLVPGTSVSATAARAL